MFKDLGFQRNRRLNIFKKKDKNDLDTKRFEEIADQRYQASLSNLHTELNTPKYDKEAMHEHALEGKKELDAEKDTIFKNWE